MASGISTDSVPACNSSSYRAKEKCDSSAISNDSDSYLLSGDPLGLCVILNYKTFSDNRHPTREGSEHDVSRLQHSFESLGFRVIVRQDVSKAQTEEFFTKLLEHDIKESHSIFAICVMSHGNSKYVSTSDCKELDYMRDIVDRFCVKKLKDVPKLFFFQFCRGNKTEIVSTDGLTPDTCTDSSDYFESFRRNRFVGFSVVEGFVSFRDHSSGSWYIQAWCDVLDNFEEGVEFRELARRVSEIVQNKKAAGEMQTNENLENLPKKLYLRRHSMPDRFTKYQVLVEKFRDWKTLNSFLKKWLPSSEDGFLELTKNEKLVTFPLSDFVLYDRKVEEEYYMMMRKYEKSLQDCQKSLTTSLECFKEKIHERSGQQSILLHKMEKEYDLVFESCLLERNKGLVMSSQQSLLLHKMEKEYDLVFESCSKVFQHAEATSRQFARAAHDIKLLTRGRPWDMYGDDDDYESLRRESNLDFITTTKNLRHSFQWTGEAAERVASKLHEYINCVQELLEQVTRKQFEIKQFERQQRNNNERCCVL